MEELKTLNEIKKDIINYYKKLGFLYAKANTKSKRKRLVSSIAILDHICSPEIFNFNDLCGVWDNDIELQKVMEKIYSQFCQNVEDNILLINETSKKTIDAFKSANYPFYRKHSYCHYLPMNIIFGLVKDFYHSFDDETVKDFINSFNKENLYVEDFPTDYSGLLFPFDVIRKNIILINNNSPQNIYFASSLAHELGHAYESFLYYKSDMFDNGNTIFSEVVSSFFEYAFLKYLKENNIYNEGIDSELDIFYLELFDDAFSSYLLSLMNDRKPSDEGEICLNDKKVMDKGEEIKSKLNYFTELPSYQDTIRYRDAFIYYIGKLFAISLYDSYKDNPKEFMKDFKTALVNYPKSRSVDSFEIVGINKENLRNSKVLTRELKQFSSESK